MLLQIYLLIAARRLFCLLVFALALGTTVGLALSWRMPNVVPESGGFLRYALGDGLANGDLRLASVAVLMCVFALSLGAVLIAALEKLSSDRTLFETSFGKHIAKKWPLSYLMALVILVLTFFAYAAAIIPQYSFGSRSMTDHLMTSLLYGYILFLSVGDLYLAWFARWPHRYA